MDAPTGEVILDIGSDATGTLQIKFRLYDSKGCPAGESGDASCFPGGIRVISQEGELLLELPSEPNGNIIYHLYNRNGDLLTSSDGVSTKIGPCLRMESWPRAGASAASRRPRPA